MKSILLSILFLFVPKLVISQISSNDKTVYLDSLWHETTQGNHKYYRIIKDYYSEKDNYTVCDYYKSGKIQMIGTSNNKDHVQEEGQFIYYYENGKKKTITYYAKARPFGKQFEWYENGNLKSEIEYFEDENKFESNYKINQYWNIENIHTVINGNGNFEDSNEKYSESGKIKDGLHDGIWKGSCKNPDFNYTENYENGKLISGVSIDPNHVEHKYTIVESRPQPKKGIEHFYSYIGKNMYIPKEAEGISGKIFLSFIVEKDGSINEIKVLKGLGYGVDEEAIRVLKNYKNWIPGTIKGINVRVLYTLPIKISGG